MSQMSLAHHGLALQLKLFAKPVAIAASGPHEQRRTPRGSLNILVYVYGHGPSQDPFHEEAHTLRVNANGAVLLLSVPVQMGQTLLLTNSLTGQEQNCRVVSLGTRRSRTIEATVEFPGANSGFWRIPPAPGDKPASRDAQLRAREGIMNENLNSLQQAEVWRSSPPTHETEVIANEANHQAMRTKAWLAPEESAVREESLKLVQKLFRPSGQTAHKTVMFAAIDSKNGCSRLCALIARLLAESVSGSVCLVEGNFRTPTLPNVLGVDNHYGLADALRQEGPIRSFAKQIGPDNCWLLSSGSLLQDSLNLLNGDRMKERLNELRKEFDYLVIDAPPLTAYADAMVLGRLVDGVVLVLEANETRREAALQVTESLRASKIPVLGAILNNRTFPIPAALYKRL